MSDSEFIASRDDVVLVTGAGGFIGSRVVQKLLERGFKNVRCFVRPSSDLSRLNTILDCCTPSSGQIVSGNLLSRDDAAKAVDGAAVILHLAAGVENSFSGAFMNSVVTTRNLLEAAGCTGMLKRFLNVSSIGVYSNLGIRRGGVLDETCKIEDRPDLRGEAYCFGKIKQDEILVEYASRYDIPYVIVRPGVVYGPGKSALTGRVGIGTFGVFLHLGGSNRIPLTYVDNCADAVVMAGLAPGVDGEVFNIVDDDLPTSRQFLKMYKSRVKRFRSIFLPYGVMRSLCWIWERYALWSKGQLPLVFSGRRCAADWKGNRYPNDKLKRLTGWSPTVGFEEAAQRYFDFMRESAGGA